MDLFVFPAPSTRDLQAAHGAGRWSVSPAPKMVASLATRSVEIEAGAHGVFYCTASKSLTVPFSFTTAPEAEGTGFTFGFDPLGSPQKEMSLGQARRLLDIGKKSDSVNSSNIFNLAPTRMFTPIDITDNDWATILRNLADKPPKPQRR